MTTGELIRELSHYCPDTKVAICSPQEPRIFIGSIAFDQEYDTVLFNILEDEDV